VSGRDRGSGHGCRKPPSNTNTLTLTLTLTNALAGRPLSLTLSPLRGARGPEA